MMAEMAEFKIGDRVRRTKEAHGSFDGSDEFVIARMSGTIVGEIRGGRVFHHSIDSLELVTPASSPIQTVTKREIVKPSTFGIGNHKIHISEAGTSTMVRVALDQRMSKNHLREAARLFNELADVLEENAKEAV